MNELEEQHSALESYLGALLAADIADLEPAAIADTQGVPAHPAIVAENPAETAVAADGGQLTFMSFQVGGLKFALDTAQVKTVIPFPAHGVEYENARPVRLTAAGRQPPLDIVDTRRRVFPEGHPGHHDTRPYGFLILLGTNTLALACDDIEQVVRVASHQVQWRRERGSRPWLAGMLNDPKCAVLDVKEWRKGACAEAPRH